MACVCVIIWLSISMYRALFSDADNSFWVLSDLTTSRNRHEAKPPSSGASVDWISSYQLLLQSIAFVYPAAPPCTFSAISTDAKTRSNRMGVQIMKMGSETPPRSRCKENDPVESWPVGMPPLELRRRLINLSTSLKLRLSLLYAPGIQFSIGILMKKKCRHRHLWELFVAT